MNLIHLKTGTKLNISSVNRGGREGSKEEEDILVAVKLAEFGLKCSNSKY